MKKNAGILSSLVNLDNKKCQTFEVEKLDKSTLNTLRQRINRETFNQEPKFDNLKGQLCVLYGNHKNKVSTVVVKIDDIELEHCDYTSITHAHLEASHSISQMEIDKIIYYGSGLSMMIDKVMRYGNIHVELLETDEVEASGLMNGIKTLFGGIQSTNNRYKRASMHQLRVDLV